MSQVLLQIKTHSNKPTRSIWLSCKNYSKDFLRIAKSQLVICHKSAVWSHLIWLGSITADSSSFGCQWSNCQLGTGQQRCPNLWSCSNPGKTGMLQSDLPDSRIPSDPIGSHRMHVVLERPMWVAWGLVHLCTVAWVLEKAHSPSLCNSCASGLPRRAFHQMMFERPSC